MPQAWISSREAAQTVSTLTSPSLSSGRVHTVFCAADEICCPTMVRTDRGDDQTARYAFYTGEHLNFP
jgi:hypothetical protein